MAKYGLIGKNIDYTISRGYNTEKFKRENLPFKYENFDIPDIRHVSDILNIKDLKGLNVTIPYKERILPFLDDIDPIAQEIGAVNTIQISSEGKTKGFNTDYTGFLTALMPFLPLKTPSALILGTGGASKAVKYGLKTIGFQTTMVSRNKSSCHLSYLDLTQENIQDYSLIVNCTPLGTYPKVSDCPPIPYDGIGDNHLLFDLIYNPEETEFLKKGRKKGARITNGLAMLIAQAEKAWEIWQNN